MEVTPAALAAYEAALPDDPRVDRKRMFGVPCAFVNRQMFFGPFEDSVVVRVGPPRVEALAGQPGMRVFSPMVDRAWRDYVQVDLPGDAETIRRLAAEALEWASRLPPKAKKPKAKKMKAAKTKAAKTPTPA